ncbi:hypothetical protein N7468_009893 [Penicillium chermesinum]|uniref:Transmembrane protein n=1 Tax=Penicillium chermesinum TaxID=63820 RepID=A0A9W9NBM9_9EURO|nr:uncharacterized protein N7468_009893 [Penicillium chermesinum]KAJ5216885.1 hypothetical protein N7468_009893 [Penicillium chermesinum]
MSISQHLPAGISDPYKPAALPPASTTDGSLGSTTVQGTGFHNETPMTSPQGSSFSPSDQTHHTTFAGDFGQTHLPSGWNVESKSLNNTQGRYTPSEQGQHTSADLHPYTTAADPPTQEHTNMPTGTSRSITSSMTSMSTMSASTISTPTAATSTIANVDMAQLAQIDIGQSSMEVHKQNIAVLFGTILSGAAAFCGIVFCTGGATANSSDLEETELTGRKQECCLITPRTITS